MTEHKDTYEMNEISVPTPMPETESVPPQAYVPPAVYAPPEGTVPPTPPREYHTAEAVFAWVCVLCGYLFCRAFPAAEHPLGAWALLLALFGATAVTAAVRRVKPKAMPLIAAAAAIVVGSGLLLCANAFLHTLAFGYGLVTYAYFLYAMFAPDYRGGFSDRLVADHFKAVIVLPFCSFGCLFGALFSGKLRQSGKQIGKIMIGVALAVIPTALVIGLLSYDDGFSKLLGDLFDMDLGTIMSHIGSAILGVPIGMYLFGLFVSSSDGKGASILPPEGCQRAAKAVRIAPQVTVLVAAAPLLFVYGVFFLSQWDYYMSAFTGILPEGLSFAEYAREGFFQLCVVAVINLIMIVAAVVFMKRREDGRSLLLTVLVSVFSLCTLVLIATALSKMMLYIDSYGLTPKRVYASWFMVVLALVFLLLTLGRFVRRLPTAAMCGAVTVVMFAALSLCGTDSLIAQYNVERYLDGTLESVDMEAMNALGDAAVPAMVRLVTAHNESFTLEGKTINQLLIAEDDPQQKEAIVYLNKMSAQYQNEERSVWEITLPRVRAEAALKSVGML